MHPVAYAVAPAPPPTTIREYRDAFERDRDVAMMAAHGWVVQQTTVIPGSYNGGKGCLLAVIFLPLALMAGNHPDRYMVTYVATPMAVPGPQPLPMPLMSGSPGLRGPIGPNSGAA